jgi:hypothetical protein
MRQNPQNTSAKNRNFVSKNSEQRRLCAGSTIQKKSRPRGERNGRVEVVRETMAAISAKADLYYLRPAIGSVHNWTFVPGVAKRPETCM